MQPFLSYLGKAALVMAFLVSSCQCMAEDFFLSGKVVDQQTGEGLSGVKVEILTEERLVFTDQLGEFYFDPGKQDSIEIRIHYIGYRSQYHRYKVAGELPVETVFSLERDEFNLEEITITAQTGKDISLLGELDIHLQPISSSQDILQIIPGLVIAQHAGGGKAEQIFLRGFDIDHGTDLQLTVDGMPVNMVSHAHGQGYSDLHFLIPETIEKVDFDKGSYEASKGNFATAGYAAFRTKNTLEENRLSLELGQFNTVRGLLMMNLLDNVHGQDLYIAGEMIRSDGYFEASQNFVRDNFMAKYKVNIGENTLFKAGISTFQSTWTASGQIPERAIEQGIIGRFGAIDSTEGGNTSRKNINLELFHQINTQSSLKAQLYGIDYDFSLFSNFTFFLEDSLNGDQIHQTENRQIIGGHVTYQLENRVGKVDMLTSIGLDLRQDWVNDLALNQTLNRGDIIEQFALGQVSETNLSVFLSQDILFGDKWKINAGVRQDFFQFSYLNELEENSDWQVVQRQILSPKLSISYKANDQWNFYSKWGLGYHTNDSRVVLEGEVEHILPRSNGFDLGTFWKPGKKLLMQAALWYLHLDQEFVYVGDAGIVEPSGATRRLGADMSMRYQIFSFLSANADLTFTHARSIEDDQGENFIPLAPVWTAQAGLTANSKKGLAASLNYRFLGDRAANEDYSLVAEGYNLFDLNLRYRKKAWQFTLQLENILNVNWKEAQFETTSQLAWESTPVTEIHFTPGTPFSAKMGCTFFW
ncbi:MAG: TonB-dependent receptor [Bacteroidota bacterium]